MRHCPRKQSVKYLAIQPEIGVDVALNQADLLAHLIIEEISLGDMMTLLRLRK